MKQNAMNKSIDFLLENAGPVIQYRLRKEILKDLAKNEEENYWCIRSHGEMMKELRK